MKKRLFSLLLCLVLCVGLLPMAALAEETAPVAPAEGEAMPEPTAEVTEAPASEPTAEPEPTAAPEVTAEPTETSAPEPTAEPEVTPEPTAEPEVTPEPTPETEVQPLSLEAAPALEGDASTPIELTQADFNSAIQEGGTTTVPADAKVFITNNGYYCLRTDSHQVGTFGSYCLGGDISLNRPICIRNMANITLDLNGHTLSRNPNTTGATYSNYIFEVRAGCLTVRDSSEEKTGTIKFADNNNGVAVYVEAYGPFAGRFILEGGTITNCTTGVYIYDVDYSDSPMSQYYEEALSSGDEDTRSYAPYYVGFTMTGGKIDGGTYQAARKAGGVYVGKSQVFVMTGGEITGGFITSADSAGGVYVAENGLFNMSGGKINTCTARGNNSAGGVLLYGDYSEDGRPTKFNMTGGEITGCYNRGNNGAGGVNVVGYSTFTMSSANSKIIHCHSERVSEAADHISDTAGGVRVSGSSGLTATFNLQAGTIGGSEVLMGCTSIAKQSAGGVYVDTGSVFNMSGGAIDSCTTTYDGTDAKEMAGGVYVSAGSEFNMSGGTIKKCYANSVGKAFVDIQNPGTNALYITGGVCNRGTFTISGTSTAVDNTNEIYGIGDNSAFSALYNAGTMNANGGTVGYLLQTTAGKIQQSSDATSTTAFPDGAKFYGTVQTGDFGGNVYCDGDATVSGGDFADATRTNHGWPYKITFNSEGGTPAPAAQWRMNAAVTEPDQNPTKAHYTFDAWSTSETGDYTAYGFSETTFEDDFTLYARWSPAPTASVTTAPTANSLTYNGTEQTLVAAGTADGGTMMYRVGTTDDFSETIPTAENAGTYAVYYMVAADDEHKDFVATNPITVTIAKKSVTVSGITAENKTYNGNTTATLDCTGATIGGNVDGDDLTVTATGTFADENVGTGKTVNITGLALDGTAKGNYALAETGQQESTTANITAKEVTVTDGITAEDKIYDGNTTATLNCTGATIDGKVDGDNLTVTATGSFADKNVGGSKQVTISGWTLGGDDKDNYVLAANGHQTTAYADITAKAVTLTSADAEKEYDGDPLTAETVTATGMVDDEKFDYDFSGTQTDIGASENAFIAKNSATATLTNYQITPVFGTLRVTVPADVDEPVKELTKDNVTSDDRKVIEDTLKTVDDYLGMEPTKEEATELNELKEQLNDLLDKLDETKAAGEDDDITAADDITKDNAKPSDKKTLKDAKKAIEDFLDDFGGNLTEAEKQALNDKLARINAALDAIEAAEKAAKAVKTGDEAMPMLWLALALSAALALGFAARKRKN